MTDYPSPTTNATAEEKVAALFNEQKLRNAQRRSESASTFQSFAQAEAEEVRGRFSQFEKANVIGSTAKPSQYPPAPNHDTTGIEPPLGYSIDEQVVVGEPHEVRASLASASLPSSPDADAEKGGADEIEMRSRTAPPTTSLGRGIADANGHLPIGDVQAPTSSSNVVEAPRPSPPTKPRRSLR
jgi:hypothetical protein